MKRDMELIRELMLVIESRDDTEYLAEELEVSGNQDITKIKGHLQLLVDAGFIKADIKPNDGPGSPYILIDSISWNGHEFLDNARNEPVWKKAMSIIAQNGGSVSVGVLTQVLASVAKQHLELS